jgi:hypothetical protein
MQILLVVILALTTVIAVGQYRKSRDRDALAARVREHGGQVARLHRVRSGHPFADTGRGWWAWRVEWLAGNAERTSWALTTREGIKEWRD